MERFQIASPSSKSSLQRIAQRTIHDSSEFEPTPNDLRKITAEKIFRIPTQQP
jgi:hypothetical protein